MPIILGPPLSGKTTRLVAAFQQALEQGVPPERILCLSFFASNATAIQQALRPRARRLPWVVTVQHFQTLLLRRFAAQARLVEPVQAISATARGLLLRQAWQAVHGLLWQASGDAPGAVGELLRVVDWISQSRTQFRVTTGEMSAHELAQVYAAYIDLCDRHRLLTFQEASLRCLELLADPAVAAEVGQLFPVLLVDDLHLARPDQLALIERLRGLSGQAAATAWLEPGIEHAAAEKHAAPELRHLAAAIGNWGDATVLSAAPGANPAPLAAAQRLTAAPGAGAKPAAASAAPIQLHVAFTVEDEAHAVAQAIVRALAADNGLRPDDVLVAAADRNLLPFAQRVLAEYGLPVAAPPAAARHTPLVRAGLLLLQRLLAGASPALDHALFDLPWLALDPVDAHILAAESEALERPILTLLPEELARLALQAATLARLEAVRAALAGLNPATPLEVLVEQGLAALGALAWAAPDAARADGFTAEELASWLAALRAWQAGLRDLEAVLAIGGARPADLLGLAEAEADQISLPGGGEGVRLVEPGQVNGVQARLAFVVGLSESAAPRRPVAMQLLPEADLPGLFADGRAVVLPRARAHAAWIEREARGLAALLTRGLERLWVSTSRYTAGGEAQLPSPFFERLLGAEGELDRDGNLVLHQPGLWQYAAQPERPAEVPLPAAPPAEPVRLLQDHTFSASQVRTYLTCPLQFFYDRVLGLETDGGLALDRGSLLHAVLNATLSGGAARAELLQRPRPLWMNSARALTERALAVLDSAWTGQPADLPGGGHSRPELAWGERFGPDLQAQAVRRWAAGILEDWAEYEVDGWPDALQRRPVLLEAGFSFELDGYRLTGRLDRVDEIQTAHGPVYEVIDYKTGSSSTGSLKAQMAKFLPEAEDAASDYQLPVYALALRSGLHGLQGAPRRLSLLNVEALTKKNNGQYRAEACRTLELVDAGAVDTKKGLLPLATLTGDIAAGLTETLGRMSASPYPAQPGFHCSWCAFRTACERAQPEAA